MEMISSLTFEGIVWGENSSSKGERGGERGGLMFGIKVHEASLVVGGPLRAFLRADMRRGREAKIAGG